MLQGSRFHCDPTPGTGSDADRDRHERTDGALPCIQAQGPCLPDVVPRPRDPHDLPFLEPLYIFLLDLAPDVLSPALREFILQYPISWTKCCITLHHMHDHLGAEDGEIFSVPIEDVKECLLHCAEPAGRFLWIVDMLRIITKLLL